MCRPGGRRCPSSTTGRPSRSGASKAVRTLAPTVAAEFHEDWREKFLHDNGGRARRMKSTTDAAWIAKNGTDRVDIAHTRFDALPADWQAENAAAATVATNFVANHLDTLGTPRDRAKTIGAGAEHVHNEWLKRNKWAKGSDLDVPFKKLPHREQLKDMAHINAVLSHLEPSRDMDFEMFASTDDIEKARGLFAASAAGSGRLTPIEKVDDVGEITRRRAGTFEDGTLRFKYTGTVNVNRELPPVRGKAKGEPLLPVTPNPKPKPKKRTKKVSTDSRAASATRTHKAAKKTVDPDPKADYTDRNTAIKAIRSSLKERSGKAWSVRGGTGTAWGWITISSPPARQQEEGYMSAEDAAELHELLGINYRPKEGVRTQHVLVPASAEYRKEHVARAQGREPEVTGTPYWD